MDRVKVCRNWLDCQYVDALFGRMMELRPFAQDHGYLLNGGKVVPLLDRTKLFFGAMLDGKLPVLRCGQPEMSIGMIAPLPPFVQRLIHAVRTQHSALDDINHVAVEFNDNGKAGLPLHREKPFSAQCLQSKRSCENKAYTGILNLGATRKLLFSSVDATSKITDERSLRKAGYFVDSILLESGTMVIIPGEVNDLYKRCIERDAGLTDPSVRIEFRFVGESFIPAVSVHLKAPPSISDVLKADIMDKNGVDVLPLMIQRDPSLAVVGDGLPSVAANDDGQLVAGNAIDDVAAHDDGQLVAGDAIDDVAAHDDGQLVAGDAIDEVATEIPAIGSSQLVKAEACCICIRGDKR
jgi:hypothetical protein